MATKKTTPAGGTAKRRTRAKTTKSAPVVLDPPKKPDAAKPAAAPQVIDAKAVEVVKSEPVKDAAKDASKEGAKEPPKPVQAQEPPKSEPRKAEPPKAEPPKSEPPKTKAPEPPRRSGGLAGFAALLAGGVVAGGIGWFANDALNPPPKDYGPDLARMDAKLTETLAALDGRIATLETQRDNSALVKLEADVRAMKAALDAEIARLGERMSGTETSLDEALAGLEAARQRLAETVAETGGEISAATSELMSRYAAEIDALKARLENQTISREELDQKLQAITDKAEAGLDAARAKVTELTEAAGEVDLALARERLNAAIETGRAYGDQLAELARAAAVDIPAALGGRADQGVPTLLQLQQGYPKAARKGLKASIRAGADDSLTGKLGAFLEAQLGARSLEEREGDDPDAILSRAEAALGRAELQAAADLVRQLPEPGVEAMAGWLKDADALLAVQAGLKELDQAIDAGEAAK
ncbi:MAG: hypothetical protein K8F59_05400 [Rhodobacteraceae bacterium]|nr:hypothetical protein [Paracoccaceae bacterium]